jgi:hypothetical protein
MRLSFAQSPAAQQREQEQAHAKPPGGSALQQELQQLRQREAELSKRLSALSCIAPTTAPADLRSNHTPRRAPPGDHTSACPQWCSWDHARGSLSALRSYGHAHGHASAVPPRTATPTLTALPRLRHTPTVSTYGHAYGHVYGLYLTAPPTAMPTATSTAMPTAMPTPAHGHALRHCPRSSPQLQTGS